MEMIESVLMSYLFNITDWMEGKKSIIEGNANKPRTSMTEILLTDSESLIDSGNIYDDYFETITWLQNASDQEYNSLKNDILDWEPIKEF
ncbi:hypothetical protein [Streptococcus sobrinus]|uniref:hypothetical protein n=1 Tax=Streptococcus sobrinus TaxID=1310 RepID=UPI0002E10BA0|nr:hypothetical protein [Streptococcus sobrinus]